MVDHFLELVIYLDRLVVLKQLLQVVAVKHHEVLSQLDHVILLLAVWVHFERALALGFLRIVLCVSPLFWALRYNSFFWFPLLLTLGLGWFLGPLTLWRFVLVIFSFLWTSWLSFYSCL